MTKLEKFCAITPLKVLGVSLILALILCVFLYLKMNSTLHRNGLAVLALYYLIAYNIICSILSFSILLNLYKIVRDNVYMSFLSFYFPILISIVTLLIVSLLYGVEAFMFIVWAIYAIPFLIPQTYYFIRFRQQMESGKLLDNNI